jgi:UDP-N-acetylmuramoyl-tripeptide--D-alanyl-D-alanine ligase
VEHPVDVHGVTVIVVKDTLVALGELARAHLVAWRKGKGRTVTGITGTAGKTTTKELAKALFSRLGSTLATTGNLNNRIGVPHTVLTLDDSHQHAVIEMGMSLRGEIAALGRIVMPDAGIITNIGVGHAEGVGGTRADVAREKGAMFEALAEDGIAIANVDDDAVVGELPRAKARRVVRFGRSGDYELVSRAATGQGQTLTLRSKLPWEVGPVRTRTVSIPLPSEAQAIDLCLALGAVEATTGRHLSEEDIEAAMATVVMTGRLAMVKLGDGTLVIDDTYNANPASMRVALRALAEAAGKERRKVAILGEMKELGPIGTMEHQALGDTLADSSVDLAIGCGGLVTLTLDRAEARGVSVRRADSTEGAADLAAELVRSGDVVLVKGSRSVGTEAVVARLISSRGRAEETS